MLRHDLIEYSRAMLARAGFAVSERCDLRPVSFDLVARRDGELVVVKVLGNVDALSEEVATEIKVLCRFLEARPLLVGLRSGTGELEDGVVYARYRIPIVTPGTLEEFLHSSDPPLVFAAPGGFYVNIDHEMLRSARQHAGLSLGALAQIAGVSRRAIQMYEAGMNASIDAAMRLEEHLDLDLVRPMDPLTLFKDEPPDEPPKEKPGPEPGSLEAMITDMLEAVGYTVQETRRSPFNALSTQKDDTLLTGMGRDSPSLRRRARVVSSVSRIIERPGFFVVEKTTRTEIEGTPVVSRKELKDLQDPQTILDLILERRPRQEA